VSAPDEADGLKGFRAWLEGRPHTAGCLCAACRPEAEAPPPTGARMESVCGGCGLRALADGRCTVCGACKKEGTMMAYRFVCREPPPRRSVVVAAEAWFDARAHARNVLGTDALDCDDAEVEDAEVVLRWTGSDYVTSGSRHLVVEWRQT
jgi:hypothetical protein